MIHIADATDAAIRLALTRCWLVAVAARRPPHDAAPASAGAVAGELRWTGRSPCSWGG